MVDRTVSNDYPTQEQAVDRIVRIRTGEGDWVALGEAGDLTVTADRGRAERFALYRCAYLTATTLPLDGAQSVSYAIRSVSTGKYLTIQNYYAEPGKPLARTGAIVAADFDRQPPYYVRRGLTFVVTASAPDVYWNERFTIADQPDGSVVIASHADDLRDEPDCAAFPMRVTLTGAYVDYGNVAVQRLYLENVSDDDSDSMPDDRPAYSSVMSTGHGLSPVISAGAKRSGEISSAHDGMETKISPLASLGRDDSDGTAHDRDGRERLAPGRDNSESVSEIAAGDGTAIDLPRTFAHPGVSLSAAQLTAMRDHVRNRERPWYADWLRLTTTVPNDMACERYQPTFREGVGRGDPAGSGHIGDWEMSCAAAYFNALRWAVTGEDRYAETVTRIIDGWARTLHVIDGRDRILGASLATIKLINAAEIVRYFDGGHPSLTDGIFKAYQTMLRNVVYPVVRDGGAPMNANGNWDVAPMTTLLAIGVATDDPRIFARGLAMYASPYCNGSIVNYLTDWGQSVESARDQAHGQLGIGAMVDACAIAEHQGVDLWSLYGNRLAKAVEWCAQYNLFAGDGELRAVPLSGIFGYFDDISYWDHMEEQGVYRGQLRPIYETALAHYRGVPGVDVTWMERAARAMRPEGLVHFDNLNFSTLTCYNGPVETADTTPRVRLRTQIEPWYQRTWAAIRACGSVPSNALADGVVPAGLDTETMPSYFAIQPDGSLAVTARRRDAAVLRVVDHGDGTVSLIDTADGRTLTVGDELPDGGRELSMAAAPELDNPPQIARFALRSWGIGPMCLAWNGRLVEIVSDGDDPHEPARRTLRLRLGATPDGRNTDTTPANWLTFIYESD
ncbi:alginate lyase family protein [Bifidobacterium sp. SO1]|uniref:alginate lyase family protein n=1 Tax=Bifidobacterium sp. SO1 TaxID=2809029 RepID=UPI001BDC4C5B|nr:alginate lyase family protein [Bifidobacterium sp. SO1]MBT1160781.1 alginate lyase family protein [Bifidobacterium sp. SO1]